MAISRQYSIYRYNLDHFITILCFFYHCGLLSLISLFSQNLYCILNTFYRSVRTTYMIIFLPIQYKMLWTWSISCISLCRWYVKKINVFVLQIQCVVAFSSQFPQSKDRYFLIPSLFPYQFHKHLIDTDFHLYVVEAASRRWSDRLGF